MWALPASSCRARLCHFERFWHLQPGMAVRLRGLQAAATLNGMPGVLEEWARTSDMWPAPANAVVWLAAKGNIG
ncbi:unnamed protein product [Effrenium voratum]|nr:unnamed protein product [Effrenium voratum]